VARDVLPEGLRERGAEVKVLEVYRTIAPEGLAERAREIAGADWITFTSSSTVENLARVVKPGVLGGVKVASIGPVTSATARKLGIEVAVEATSYTIEGLVDAIISA
jgi:uroporphyrinogen III methyltransferase/synthase